MDLEQAKASSLLQVPPLKLFLLNPSTNRYCAWEPNLNSVTTTSQSGDWYLLNVPMTSFGCQNVGMPLEELEQLEFQNTAANDALFCIADLKLVHG